MSDGTGCDRTSSLLCIIPPSCGKMTDVDTGLIHTATHPEAQATGQRCASLCASTLLLSLQAGKLKCPTESCQVHTDRQRQSLAWKPGALKQSLVKQYEIFFCLLAPDLWIFLGITLYRLSGTRCAARDSYLLRLLKLKPNYKKIYPKYTA